MQNSPSFFGKTFFLCSPIPKKSSGFVTPPAFQGDSMINFDRFIQTENVIPTRYDSFDEIKKAFDKDQVVFFETEKLLLVVDNHSEPRQVLAYYLEDFLCKEQ